MIASRTLSLEANSRPTRYCQPYNFLGVFSNLISFPLLDSPQPDQRSCDAAHSLLLGSSLPTCNKITMARAFLGDFHANIGLCAVTFVAWKVQLKGV